MSPRSHGVLAQPAVTSTRPASASTVIMAAASTQTQDDSVDACPAQNASKLNESASQTVPRDGMRASEPVPNKPVSDVPARRSAGLEHAEYSSGVADWSCNAVPRPSAVNTQSVASSSAPSFIDRQTARVRPRILTHVIEGFVIHEANEPFPVCNLICCLVISNAAIEYILKSHHTNFSFVCYFAR